MVLSPLKTPDLTVLFPANFNTMSMMLSTINNTRAVLKFQHDAIPRLFYIWSKEEWQMERDGMDGKILLGKITKHAKAD
jgi:hypothetical protein